MPRQARKIRKPVGQRKLKDHPLGARLDRSIFGTDLDVFTKGEIEVMALYWNLTNSKGSLFGLAEAGLDDTDLTGKTLREYQSWRGGLDRERRRLADLWQKTFDGKSFDPLPFQLWSICRWLEGRGFHASQKTVRAFVLYLQAGNASLFLREAAKFRKTTPLKMHELATKTKVFEWGRASDDRGVLETPKQRSERKADALDKLAGLASDPASLSKVWKAIIVKKGKTASI